MNLVQGENKGNPKKTESGPRENESVYILKSKIQKRH